METTEQQSLDAILAAETNPEVRIFRTSSELESIRIYWSAWVQDPLSDFEFYANSIANSEGTRSPFVMALFRHHEPVALLAATKEQQRIRLKVGPLKVPAPRTCVLSFAYGGILGDQSSQTTELFVRTILKCLRDKEADIATFHNVMRGSQLHEAVIRVPNMFQLDHMPMESVHYIMDLPESHDLLYRRLSHDHRKRLRQAEKKVLGAYPGAVKVVKYQCTCELPRFIEQAENIACKTYQRAIGVGFSLSPLVVGRLRLAAEKQQFRGYVLQTSGHASAFATGIVYHGTFYLEFVGYDQELSQYSPGTLLLTRVMEDLCAEGNVTDFDFGFGSELYKERFGTRRLLELRINIFGMSVRGVTVNAMRIGTRAITEPLMMFLRKTNLFGTLKSRWRARLRKQQVRASYVGGK
jgi:Acetyltransferase (GNAT) domain